MMIYASQPKNRLQHGFTLVEVLVSTALVAVFFAAIFELNALCLRTMGSGKEGLAALQSVQDRSEVLRNRAFDDLTRTTCDPCVPVFPLTTCVTIPCVRDLMATPANPAPFSQKATEVVTISNYPSTANGVTRYTRSPNGSVTTNSLRTDPVTNLVQVDVRVDWAMTGGGRARREQTSFIVAKGNRR